ncbi:MAG: bacillithiol biosynthesis deacetylase BshB1 [Gammaproteobacteria bacterium]|nr:bacillithiol biosynthesis deacetylase BshB1 [Gammaproteobacteria bacterium]
MNTVDVLAIAAHPDDVEVSCSGLLMRMADQGYKIGILDLTRGEMGSRGTAELRTEEALLASKIMGLSARENAELPDARLTLTENSREVIASYIRKLRPALVILPTGGQRHPDHNATAEIAYAGIFAAGLKKFPVPGDIHRPDRILYSTSFQQQTPSFYVDITAQIDRKLEAVAAYRSQFGEAGSTNPVTKQDMESYILNGARSYGLQCGVEYAEPYWIKEAQRIDDPIKELRLNSI